METGIYLEKLIKIAKELESLDFFMGKAKLSKTEFRLLQEVLEESRNGRKIISSELARRLGVTRSAVSQIVTKLEKEEIVKRTPSSADKKIAYIMLSDYFTQVFREQCERAQECMRQVVERFGEERLDRLIAELDELFLIFRETGKVMNAG